MSGDVLIIQDTQPAALVKVVDEITREQATNRIIVLKKGRSRVVEYHKPTKQSADQLHKMIKKQEQDMLDVYDRAIKDQDEEVKAYLRDEERKRKEAREKAEKEVREKKEKEQQKAIEEGNIEKAVEIEEKPMKPAPTATVAPLPQKTFKAVAGTASSGKETKVEIIDVKAFFKYCYENDLSELWDVKLGAVKSMVKSKGLKEIPGLRIYEDFATSYRAAR
jgi:hypothetical protein